MFFFIIKDISVRKSTEKQ